MSDQTPDLTQPGTVIDGTAGPGMPFYDDDGDYTGVLGYGHYTEVGDEPAH